MVETKDRCDRCRKMKEAKLYPKQIHKRWVYLCADCRVGAEERDLTYDQYMLASLQRLWARVDTDGTECQIWTGPLTKDGFGQIRFSHGGKVWTEFVHRFSYSMFHNIELSPETKLYHTCGKGACCNPKHIKVKEE